MPRLLALSLLLPVTASAETWLCVGSPPFLEAAAPLISHRRSQGLTVQTSSAPVPEAIRQCPERPAFILLLGDEVLRADDAAAPWHLPSLRRPFHGWKDSHPKEFVTDMAYGDFDGDGMPEASVGRLPARSSVEVQAGVQKILRWEKRAPSLADLTIPIWAGDPGFTPLFRDMALGFLFRQIRGRSPAWAELWVMQGDERSPFCGWPLSQPADFNARISAGSLLSGMIGHGSRTSWWSMDLKEGRLHYDVKHTASFSGPAPSAPHIIFACETGSFALRDREGLAEALFRAPGGPVLCAGATEDSHPLTNYYHSTTLLSALGSSPLHFGTLWISSLRTAAQAHEPDKEALVHNLLEPLFIGKKLRTEDIRADHNLLYNLMGDPATRLFSPSPLKAEITEANGHWQWKVPQPPRGARLLVQVRAPLPDFALTAPAASAEEAARRRSEANTLLAFHTKAELPAGKPWQGRTPGPGTLRLVAVTDDGLAVAAATMQAAAP